MQVHFIDNRNIRGFNIFKIDLHLSGKRLLANNFVDNFNIFFISNEPTKPAVLKRACIMAILTKSVISMF